MSPLYKYSSSIFLMLGYCCLFGQSTFKVLHYTETSGYDHGTRGDSYTMFQSLGTQNGFSVDDDQTGASFDSLALLQEYAVVVFSNTSGDQILDSVQRSNFEAYINTGGSFLGIHAASDTYRHSTANGSNTGTWDWYAETLGGSVQQSPNHTSANHSGTMNVLMAHPTTANTPDPWNKVEEYYYWGNGFLDSANTNLLEVRSTGSNTYDTARPMSWYKILSGGGKSFYTALGHANSNYTSDTAFQNHIRDAVTWAADKTTSLKEGKLSPFHIYPIPAKTQLHISSTVGMGPASYRILDLSGKVLNEGQLHFEQRQATLKVEHLTSGQYLLEIRSGDSSSSKRLPFVIH